MVYNCLVSKNRSLFNWFSARCMLNDDATPKKTRETKLINFTKFSFSFWSDSCTINRNNLSYYMTISNATTTSTYRQCRGRKKDILIQIEMVCVLCISIEKMWPIFKIDMVKPQNLGLYSLKKNTTFLAKYNIARRMLKSFNYRIEMSIIRPWLIFKTRCANWEF